MVAIAIAMPYCCTATSLILQIDLIDMRHRPDGVYKWIGHYMDHWSKLHFLFPLARKSGAEVGLNLENHVFAVVGVPKILHSDNGREFVYEIVENVVKQWPEEVTIVNGHVIQSARAWSNKETLL